MILHDLLLPEPAPVPAGRTLARVSLAAGLPARIDLLTGVHAMLVLPTGLARQWWDAAPTDVVATAADDRASFRADRPARPPLRLVVLRGGEVLGSVPLAVGLRRTCPDSGARPAVVEVTVLDWLLLAGTVRGPGDYGSFLSLAWRAADGGEDTFEVSGRSVPGTSVRHREEP